MSKSISFSALDNVGWATGMASSLSKFWVLVCC